MSNPTLTTTITSSEPYMVGEYITFTSVLQSQTGDPIPDELVSFRTPTQILGTLSTDTSGIINFALGVPQTPGTFEVYTTHMTDDNIVIESNHITFTTEEPVETCTQEFRFEDQNGNPLSGSITGEDIDPPINITVSGDGSATLINGKTYTVTAFTGALELNKTFTACTDTITFNFTITVEKPTLTTSITSSEPYVAGTIINLKTILTSPDGIPISGKNVFFYSSTEELLGSDFTNVNGELILAFQTGITPSTYEIYSTHMTDDDVFVESNHITFTTEEAAVEPCHQGFRLEDQNGNPISGIITISGEDHHIPATGEISLPLTEGQNYIAVAKVGTLMKQHSFIACTPQIILKFTIIEQCTQQFRLEDQNGNPISGTLSITETDFDVTGDISLSLEQDTEYLARAVVEEVSTQKTFTACTDKIIFIFTINDYTPTSLSISTDPIEIGVGQFTDITGTLTIQGQDQILPGIPLKLYCDKGQGYQVIHTPTTPASGTGIVTYHYGAQSEDAGKTLKFKYEYEGSDTLKLNPSESGVAELTVVETTPIPIDTPDDTGLSVFIPIGVAVVIGLGILGIFIKKR